MKYLNQLCLTLSIFITVANFAKNENTDLSSLRIKLPNGDSLNTGGINLDSSFKKDVNPDSDSNSSWYSESSSLGWKTPSVRSQGTAIVHGNHDNRQTQLYNLRDSDKNVTIIPKSYNHPIGISLSEIRSLFENDSDSSDDSDSSGVATSTPHTPLVEGDKKNSVVFRPPHKTHQRTYNTFWGESNESHMKGNIKNKEKKFYDRSEPVWGERSESNMKNREENFYDSSDPVNIGAQELNKKKVNRLGYYIVGSAILGGASAGVIMRFMSVSLKKDKNADEII